jgi:oligogalacturonide lyase
MLISPRVNMSYHDYREKPDVRFSSGKTNGLRYEPSVQCDLCVWVDVKKAENPASADVKDTAELGRRWKPQTPEPRK